MASSKKKAPTSRNITQNRKARYNYELTDEWEAGICLTGSEVKSLRTGKSNIADSYADIEGEELFLLNSYIAPYEQAGKFGHEAKRPRKLLLHKKEVKRILGMIKTKGLTLIPLSLYFNARGRVKVQLALAKGKKRYDKRETEKKRDWDREKARVIRESR